MAIIVDHLPLAPPARILDVGCGTGRISHELHRAGYHVVGIDPHGPSLEVARQEVPGGTFVRGDVLTHELPQAPFDGVVAVGSLHHFDLDRGLQRIHDLLRPGGWLAALGYARSTWRDLPWLVATQAVRRITRPAERWAHPSPKCWPPPHDFSTTRRIVAAHLPGHRWQRDGQGRYVVSWQKPVPTSRMSTERPTQRGSPNLGSP